jgi:dTDP-4-dehydrorhamnose reductase
MKICIIGSNGQLGTDIYKESKEAGYEVFPLNHTDIDIRAFSRLQNIFNTIKPDVVINTAAYHNTDVCEKTPIISFEINSFGARNLALLSNDFKFKLIHFSTDYVFDGEKDWTYFDDDVPNPINIYGTSKFAGELFIKNISENYFIIRVSSLFGPNQCRAKNGLNFVQLMLKSAKENKPIQVVDDQVSSPTYTPAAAKEVIKFVKNDYQKGIYHLSCVGSCSWYKYAEEIFNIKNLTPQLSPKKTIETPGCAKRPKNSSLATTHRDIIRMPHWKEALKKYLSET